MLARCILLSVFVAMAAARAVSENPLHSLAPRDCSNPGVTSFCVSLLSCYNLSTKLTDSAATRAAAVHRRRRAVQTGHAAPSSRGARKKRYNNFRALLSDHNSKKYIIINIPVDCEFVNCQKVKIIAHLSLTLLALGPARRTSVGLVPSCAPKQRHRRSYRVALSAADAISRLIVWA